MKRSKKNDTRILQLMTHIDHPSINLKIVKPHPFVKFPFSWLVPHPKCEETACPCILEKSLTWKIETKISKQVKVTLREIDYFLQEKQTKTLKSPQIPSTPKSLIYLERLQKTMHLFKKGHNIWRIKKSSRKIKCMRVEMKKSIEKFGAETEKVFRKQNKKNKERNVPR